MATAQQTGTALTEVDLWAACARRLPRRQSAGGLPAAAARDAQHSAFMGCWDMEMSSPPDHKNGRLSKPEP